jgi:hypothetical protein
VRGGQIEQGGKREKRKNEARRNGNKIQNEAARGAAWRGEACGERGEEGRGEGRAG